MTNDKINISEFPKHIFWNYTDGVDLDKNIIIENVLLYGELRDYRKLLALVSKGDIKKITERIERSGKYKKRINFINKVVLS